MDIDPVLVYDVSSQAVNCEGPSLASEFFNTDPAPPNPPDVLSVQHMDDPTKALVTLLSQVVKGAAQLMY
jgi:hypothetical protein